MRAKTEEREAARRLRRDGRSVKGIAAELGVAASSVHRWVRDIELSPAQREALDARDRRYSVQSSLIAGIHAHLHPKSKGDAAEAMVLAAFVARGFVVSRPFNELGLYDLVVDDGNRLARVQVKHARLSENGAAVIFATSSGNQYGSRRYTGTDCDFFAAWCSSLGTMYLIPQADVDGRAFAGLRLRRAKNRQQTCVRWAPDYEFTGKLPWPDGNGLGGPVPPASKLLPARLAPAPRAEAPPLIVDFGANHPKASNNGAASEKSTR